MKFIQDDSGNVSSMRVAVIASVIVVLSIFVLANVTLMIKALMVPTTPVVILDFQPQMVWVLGIAFAGKFGQKIVERVKSNGNGNGNGSHVDKPEEKIIEQKSVLPS